METAPGPTAREGCLRALRLDPSTQQQQYADEPLLLPRLPTPSRSTPSVSTEKISVFLKVPDTRRNEFHPKRNPEEQAENANKKLKPRNAIPLLRAS